ncbi:MAG TPA: hypothetical protein VGL04_13155, partial [Sporichthyaceae bacterium]
MPAVDTVDLTEHANHDHPVEPSATGTTNPRRRRRYLRDPRPWRSSDLRRALVLLVIGAVLAGWGWFKVSGKVRLHDQQGWAALACLGAAIAACGGVYLLTVSMREVRLGQRQLMFDLADVMGWTVSVTDRGRLRLHAGDESRTDVVAHAEASVLVTGPGMTIVHRSECPIARGKPVSEISAAD